MGAWPMRIPDHPTLYCNLAMPIDATAIFQDLSIHCSSICSCTVDDWFVLFLVFSASINDVGRRLLKSLPLILRREKSCSVWSCMQLVFVWLPWWRYQRPFTCDEVNGSRMLESSVFWELLDSLPLHDKYWVYGWRKFSCVLPTFVCYLRWPTGLCMGAEDTFSIEPSKLYQVGCVRSLLFFLKLLSCIPLLFQALWDHFCWDNYCCNTSSQIFSQIDELRALHCSV